MYIFGISIDLSNALFYFCIVLVTYFFILEVEFREIRKITKNYDNQEIELGKEVRALREEISQLTSMLKG